MKLNIEWVGATRPHEEKVRVEATIRDTILDFFEGGVESVQRKVTIHAENAIARFRIGQRRYITVIGQSRVWSPRTNTQTLVLRLPLSKR